MMATDPEMPDMEGSTTRSTHASAQHGVPFPHRYKLILDGNLVFPEHVKPQCRDLIRNLVQPTVRASVPSAFTAAFTAAVPHRT